MIKWRDAYTSTKNNLKQVIKDLNRTALCKTHGKVVYKDKMYTVLLQHEVKGCAEGNDYFIIPTALIYGKRHKAPRTLHKR